MPANRAYYVLTVILISIATLASAQSDPERFAEGRVALDTHKDCPTAYRVLSGVSENGRKDAMWIYYMGKTTECLKRYGDALFYYRAYSKLIPPNAELLNKIGELQYAADKEAEEQKNARDLAEQKTEERAIAAEQRADERKRAKEAMETAADQKKAAQERLPQTLSRLRVLLDVTVNDKHLKHYRDRTIAIDGCNIVYLPGWPEGWRYTFALDSFKARVQSLDNSLQITDYDLASKIQLDYFKPNDPETQYIGGAKITLNYIPNKQESDEIQRLFNDVSLACDKH